MSKIEAVFYTVLGGCILAIVPTDEIAIVYQVALAFAGGLFGIVAWNLLNEDVGDIGDDK